MSVFEGAESAPVVCLGCRAWFESIGELHRSDRHAEDCDRPGEVFR